jgi:uncharacterized protein YggE
MHQTLCLVALAVLAAGCAPMVHRSAGPPQGITVTGIGRVAVPPDLAVVDVGAEAIAPRLADATAEVERRITAVLAAAKALGVKAADVRTVAYAIDPIASAPRPGEASAHITGYRVTNVVRMRTGDLAAVGRILDAAVQAGANVIRGLGLTLADPAPAESRARAAAAQDAAVRARQLAEAAGVRLGPLVSLTESGAVQPLGRMTAAATYGGAGPIEPGLHEIVVTVEARYRLEP